MPCGQTIGDDETLDYQFNYNAQTLPQLVHHSAKCRNRVGRHQFRRPHHDCRYRYLWAVTTLPFARHAP